MEAQKLVGATGCLISCTLAAGSTTTVGSTGTFYYAIKGKGYTAAAWSTTGTPTTDAATGAAFKGVLKGFGSVFVYGLDHSGAIKCAQGSIVPLDTSTSTYAWSNSAAPQFPELPDDFCPVGYLTILAGSTADATTGWIQGTSNQASVTGITYARHDVALGMPDRPQTS